MRIKTETKVMKIKSRVIFGLVTFALLQINQQHHVRCIDAAAKLENIHQRLAQLGDSFNEKLHSVFYDHQQVADNPPLHAISAYIAELEAIVYVYQRSALIVAEGIIKDYFIDRSIPLEENLEESDTLIDLAVNLLLKRSADNTVRGIEKQRKNIYLLSKTYQDVPGVVDVVKIYFQEIDEVTDRQQSCNRQFEESLERYRDEGWLFSQAHATESTVLVALDRIVSGSMDRMNADQLLEKYADPKLLLDIRLAKINMPPDMDALLLQPVSMREVLDYESKRLEQIEETMGIVGYLRSIDRKVSDLRVQFEQSMNEVFYQQQAIAEKERNVPLLSLAVQAAEIESLMYAFERNMLLVIKDMIEQQYDGFNRILEITNVPIDIIKYRLLENATRIALEEQSRRRKVIYLLFRRYDYVEAIKELANRYFALITRHKAKKDKARELSIALNRKLSESLPELMVPELIKYIDEMVEAGTNNWFRLSTSMGEMVLIKEHVEPILYESLMMAKRITAHSVDSVGQNLIDSVSMDDVASYEMRKTRIGEDAPGIGNYLKEVDDQLHELDEQFKRDFEALFYNRQLSVYDFEDYPLMALSAQMSELTALMYAGERRMLVIIKGMLKQQVFTFDHFLMVNKIPVEITMQRLAEYALGTSLRRIEHRRRKIYIVLRRYDYIAGVKILGRRYVQRLHAKEKRLTHIRALVNMYKSEAAKALPPELLSVLMSSVDTLVDDSANKWSVVTSDNGLLKSAGIPPVVLDDIQDSKRKSYNKVLRPTQQSIDEIDPEELRLYEEGLISRID